MKKKIIFAVIILAILVIAGFAAFQFAGGIKKDIGGEGIAPSYEPPKPLQQSRADQLSNSQVYKLFVGEGFEVKYPDWPGIDLKNIADTEKIKIAVASAGCVFMVRIADIPEGMTFKMNTEKLLADQAEKISKTLIKEVGDDRAHFEGEMIAGKVTLKNVSYTYLTGKNQSAGVAFAANVDNFDQVCQPIIAEVVASIAVK